MIFARVMLLVAMQFAAILYDAPRPVEAAAEPKAITMMVVNTPRRAARDR